MPTLRDTDTARKGRKNGRRKEEESDDRPLLTDDIHDANRMIHDLLDDVAAKNKENVELRDTMDRIVRPAPTLPRTPS